MTKKTENFKKFSKFRYFFNLLEDPRAFLHRPWHHGNFLHDNDTKQPCNRYYATNIANAWILTSVTLSLFNYPDYFTNLGHYTWKQSCLTQICMNPWKLNSALKCPHSFNILDVPFRSTPPADCLTPPADWLLSLLRPINRISALIPLVGAALISLPNQERKAKSN